MMSDATWMSRAFVHCECTRYARNSIPRRLQCNESTRHLHLLLPRPKLGVSSVLNNYTNYVLPRPQSAQFGPNHVVLLV